jgi:hypothetical protein
LRKAKGEDEQNEALTRNLAQLEDARKHKGAICPSCHKFRTWYQMYVVYEKRGTDWFMLWFDHACGTLVLENNLEDRA